MSTLDIDSALVWAYRYMFKCIPWDEDAPGEFVLRVEPILRRFLARWEDRGIPIKHGVSKVIRFQAKLFARLRVRNQELRCVADTAESTTGACQDARQPDAEAPVSLPKRNKRALFFAALTCPELPEEYYLSIARNVGTDRAEALRLRDALSGYVNESRLDHLRGRRAEGFAKMLAAQWRLRVETDATKRAELTGREQRARKAMADAHRQLRGLRVSPSHGTIGKVLGIPKGTIDSALYWLHRQYTA